MEERDHYGDADHRYSMDIQCRICAAMVRDPSNFVLYQDIIKPEYFEHETMADIVTMVFAFYERYDRLPLGDELTQGMIDLLSGDGRKPVDVYLKVLEQVLTMEEGFDFARDKAIEFAKHQAMKNFLFDSVELIKKRKYTRIDELCREALSVGEVSADLGVDVLATLEERLAKRSMQGDRRALAITTGLAKLDNALRGGISKDELGIIMAYTKIGKSIISVNFSMGALTDGKNVLHIIMEGSEDAIQASYDACISNVPWDDLDSRKDDVREAWNRFNAIKRGNGRLMVKHYPTEVCSAKTVESYLQQLRLTSNFIPDLIILDYLTLMIPSDPALARELRISSFPRYIGAIVAEVLSLTQRYGYATWLLHQSYKIDEGQWDMKDDSNTKKKGKGRRLLRMSHSSDSSEPMKHAHIVLTLNQDDDEYEEGVMRIHVAGGRNIPSRSTLTFGIYKDRAKIYDPETEVPV